MMNNGSSSCSSSPASSATDGNGSSIPNSNNDRAARRRKPLSWWAGMNSTHYRNKNNSSPKQNNGHPQLPRTTFIQKCEANDDEVDRNGKGHHPFHHHRRKLVIKSFFQSCSQGFKEVFCTTPTRFVWAILFCTVSYSFLLLVSPPKPPSRTDHYHHHQTPPYLVLPPVAIQQRHQCIQQARDRHSDVFGPLLSQASLLLPPSQQEESTLPIIPNWLIDPAYHDNFGDTMLTKGELQLFSNHGLYVEECLFTRARPEVILPSCNEVLQDELWTAASHHHHDEQPRAASKLAFWHAGGNWGDLYTAQQAARIPSMEELLQRNFTVIGMPQSLFYQNPTRATYEAQRLLDSIQRGLGASSLKKRNSRRQYEQTDRVLLTWREQTSLEKAETLYPFVKHAIVPDIAFQLGPFQPIHLSQDAPLRVDVLIFLRKDGESLTRGSGGGGDVQSILESIWPADSSRSYRVVDWSDRFPLFFSEPNDGNRRVLPTNVHFDLDPAIRLLSLGNVAIVDRLHAAILCYLTGIPFVYLDQISLKLTKTLGAAFNTSADCQDPQKGFWRRSTSLSDAIAQSFALASELLLNQ